MDALKQHDGGNLGSIEEPDGDQHDDEDDNNVNMGIPPHKEGVSTGEPSAIQEESSSALEEDDDNLLSEFLAVPTEVRKIQHDEDLTHEVAKTPDDRFNNVEGSPILSKIPKTN